MPKSINVNRHINARANADIEAIAILFLSISVINPITIPVQKTIKVAVQASPGL
uniref:hypothetical protein n=1 Tax=Enterobacteriaceae TaxID=543 RepID=UPI00155DC887|nr:MULTISPECIES: hypothetical protein [Enterobacteriaceae]